MVGRRLGVLGGTFDPPHIGHLAAAVEARSALGLDRVLLVVANDPWQKSAAKELTPAAVRLEMVRAACEGVEGVEVCDREIVRGGPSYSVETLEWLTRQGPDDRLFLLVGADAAAGLDTWHRHEDLAALATIVVVDRAGSGPFEVPSAPDAVHLSVGRLDVSSSELRGRVSEGRPLQPYVPSPVIGLIVGHGLYGAERR